MTLAALSAGFQSLPPLPTIKWGLSGADSRVGGLVHAQSFSCCHLSPHGCFQSEVLSFISPHWSPVLCALLCSPAIPPSLSMHECGAAGSASHHLVGCSLAYPVAQSATSLVPPAAALP